MINTHLKFALFLATAPVGLAYASDEKPEKQEDRKVQLHKTELKDVFASGGSAVVIQLTYEEDPYTEEEATNVLQSALKSMEIKSKGEQEGQKEDPKDEENRVLVELILKAKDGNDVEGQKKGSALFRNNVQSILKEYESTKDRKRLGTTIQLLTKLAELKTDSEAKLTASAQLMMGVTYWSLYYFDGKKSEDLEATIKWLTKAKDQGEDEARTFLAKVHLSVGLLDHKKDSKGFLENLTKAIGFGPVNFGK